MTSRHKCTSWLVQHAVDPRHWTRTQKPDCECVVALHATQAPENYEHLAVAVQTFLACALVVAVCREDATMEDVARDGWEARVSSSIDQHMQPASNSGNATTDRTAGARGSVLTAEV